MLNARRQAEAYARALPDSHEWPPFIIVCDVGRAFEIFADFTGKGRSYTQFPDRQSFRISLDDLRREDIRERLRLIWTNPLGLDPAKKAAEVTRDIAGRLSIIAKRLEGRHDPKDVAEFLMRCLFTMFAEDVGLLPEKLMVEMLEKLVGNPSAFPLALESLWRTMNTGGFDQHSFKPIKHFNGGLFANPVALPLAPEDINELLIAARMDWRDVEPAIFGTLLERALDPRERSKLGAHYTPRAYVERLVVPTIMEPLQANWERAQAEIEDALRSGNPKAALAIAKAFHQELCVIRVLDPACGTGNFLYVALELLKKLEGEVLDAIEELGDTEIRLQMQGETVGPNQFYGLEVNPRAVPIADLVLWIGYLKWQLRNSGLSSISEPVLHRYGTIMEQDAILAHDGRELARDNKGVPITRWDGVTRMPHPITGEPVPDPEARVELYAYKNPRPAEWPEVEFIVGNPPFIGRRTIRRSQEDGYLDALTKAHPSVPENVDLVMYWWKVAADVAKNNKVLRRFGFITTNSISQTFNRKVLEASTANSASRVSIVFAIPDHPWVDETDGASVRIAMSVAQSGNVRGVLQTAVAIGDGEEALGQELSFESQEGYISPRLTLSAEAADPTSLLANAMVSSVGYQLTGAGFLVDPTTRQKLIAYRPEAAPFVHPWTNGASIQGRPRVQYAIDVSQLSESELRTDLPELYAHLRDRVRPERRHNRRASVRDRWWVYGEARNTFRPALLGISTIAITCLTATHRVFVLAPVDTIADSTTVVFALEDIALLTTMHSRIHSLWAIQNGARLGVGNDLRYTKSECFDPFPFPDLSTNPTLKSRLSDLGERLDAFRKERLAAHGFLTMTGLYNVLERVRELDWKAGPGRHSENATDIAPLSDKECDIYDAGHIAILKDIHDEIDTLVLAAYGWSDLASELVGRPGATTPSPYKTDAQLAAEEDMLTRLVALNQERAAEEARGLVRWLRPDYQIPKLGHKVARPDGTQTKADLVIQPGADRPKWPSENSQQITILVDLLRKAPTPVQPDTLAATFDGRNTPKRRERIASLLDTLTTIGLARSGRIEGENRYFIPR